MLISEMFLLGKKPSPTSITWGKSSPIKLIELILNLVCEML